ncbi:DUF4238 domain-containing protein [uncultured Maritalea sp.]|uniref:DUF4238 domain-containing protein n=1 Tax=uncultured Maritalea sp. TaxID=757249 RepID=UPI00262AE859|nr:DUF4238 domain-containing protein [uncultured Maritalea sp.]
MSVTRRNHYIPQWHQKRFFSDTRNTLSYLDLKPPLHLKGDGSQTPGNSLFPAPTTRAFVEHDLYSTFFGTAVNDEVERRLFGDIDARGADAIRAFSGLDQAVWHSNFENLFEFLDIQKLRTPKGLAWLRTQYPELSQNELMQEMQGLSMLNVTTWTTGVREIISAEHSDTKFILTDHPVTIYNHAIPPNDARNEFPNDPSIALKGSQTIYPLGQDHCLILTNLEYAQNPSVNALNKKTFARSFQQAMVSTINFIRTRHLTKEQVIEVNFIAKARAHRYIAAGQNEWLFPEKLVTKPWHELRSTLLPPEHELHQFGGELYVGYEDGRSDYQDQFGRSEKPRPWLIKVPPAQPLKNKDLCPCGFGLSFSHCCKQKPTHLRTSWTEKSIRERNLMFMNGIENLLDLGGKDWDDLRREMTDEKIVKLYRIYEGLWPRETDLLSLLPKPDGTFRSVYTGSLHPKLISEFALGASVYFGEIIMQHPFINPMSLAKDKRPTEDPHAYRGEVLKSLLAFLSIFPLVEAGRVHLIPDPWDFDLHLRNQTMRMAEARRAQFSFNPKDDARMKAIFDEDLDRMMLGLPNEALLSQLAQAPGSEQFTDPEQVLEYIAQVKLADPLAVLQENSVGTGGQFDIIKLIPNFEMSMYLAQATGAQILTDSPFRWKELRAALNRRYLSTTPALHDLQTTIQATPFCFPLGDEAIWQFKTTQAFSNIASVFDGAFKYLQNRKTDERKPNFELQLAARFQRDKRGVDVALENASVPHALGKVTSIFRLGGFQDNTVNRLLLMSSSEHHLQSVPMATFVSRLPSRAPD